MIELFSREFTNNFWGKHAAEFAVEDIPFAEQDVLDAMEQYALHPAEIRARNPQSEAITALNGVRTEQPRADFLLAPGDTSIEAYVSRVDRLVGDDEWTVMYYGLYAASPRLWDAAKLFSDQLAHTLGYRPGGRVDIDCFIGRYSSTYIGVHVDYAHNFAFTLRDGKTMFTWPGGRDDLLGKKWPDYDAHKEEGTPLANRTDRVAYFPQDALHVAETKDAVSVNVNIAFWETGNDAQLNANYVADQLQVPNRHRRDLTSSGLAALNQDDSLLLSSIEQMVSDKSLKRRMLISQLIHDTSGRIGLGRPIIEVDQIDDVVALNEITTLQWIPLPETGEMLVAVNGHCASHAISRELQDFLRALSNGESVDISGLATANGQDDQLLAVVANLARWGAF